ncbi:MAG: ATP-binding cassette domain-containing protein [Magnetococcales bacterium]|nr:ATP-binding cassette domain-containing protein [Magnetococcales bacterium]MBF0321448.1 ATP-binding cassette domain-containing protein [Magnetococcales bacterium]
MADVILEARNLGHRYPGGNADSLQGLNLRIIQGERLALLGANGAGKTTLLLHLNGTLRPHTGEIFLHGKPVRYDRAALTLWRQEVGVVLQEADDQLFAASVAEDVSFGPLNLGLAADAARQRVTEALEALEITSLAERPPHLLSHGQRKRAAMAGVLAMRPRILILDEPTAGLDHLGKSLLLATLTQLSTTGTTIVFSTHDVDLAYAWADSAALFAHGQVLAQGATTSIMADVALLHSAQMESPAVLTLQQALHQCGVLAADFPSPRSVADLARMISEIKK